MKLVVLGAGGHARSVIDALRSAGEHEVIACTDPRTELHGSEIAGVAIVGADDQLERLRSEGVDGAVIGVGGVGDNGPRTRAFEAARELGFSLPAVVHRTSVVSPEARIGDGSVVLAAAVVGPGAVVGRNVVVNTAAVVEHDCELFDHVHVASGAVLGGHVTVEEAAHVGLGATVIQGARVGTRSIVGAGAVVVRDVDPGVVVVGAPAATLRSV